MKKFILTCVLAGMLVGVLFSFTSCFEDDKEPAVNSDDEPKTSSVQSDTDSDQADSEGEGEVDDCYVKIVSAEKGEDFQGEPVVIVTFEWSNNSDSNKMFGTVFSVKAFQGGVQCSENVLVEGVDITKQLSEMKPGITTQLSIAYSLEDNSDVTVEISPLISFSDKVVASRTFSME